MTLHPAARFVAHEVAGIRIPDSKLARNATEMVREASSASLFNHVVRTYLFGELLGRSNAYRYDSELLYLSAIMHDLGLTDRFAGQERFEVDGADAAEAFLLKEGVSQEKTAIVWDAIALHSSLGIAERHHPQVALLHLGAGVDVAGFRLDQIEPSLVEEVFRACPRLGFKKVLLQSIAGVVRKKPATAAFNMAADVGHRMVPGFQSPNFCDLVSSAPFTE